MLLECYVDALCAEIRQINDTRCFDTIYFGGGTPGILLPNYIDRIAEQIHDISAVAPKEWTVEIAPNTVSQEKLAHWKSAGVNRISMGVQSFNEATLRTLGRKQTSREIFSAYQLIHESGFKNVGLDLIFGAPGQTEAQLIDDLEQAIALNPEHISTYCLTYEDDTPLTVSLGDRSDECRDGNFYEIICDFLMHHGYKHYEISNFSKPGYASLHNLNTWRMCEWIGTGPSASSQYGEKRYTNVANLQRWADGITNGAPDVSDEKTLNRSILDVDKIIFGLRMSEGVDLCDNLYKDTTLRFAKNWPEFFIISADRIKLTQRGQLICDAISRELFNIIDE